MIITNCPKCGSMNITTAGVCSYCGWSQFNKSMVSTDVLLDVATPIDVALRKRIAELEAERRWIPVSERLPEDRVTILAAFNNREILTAKYYKYYSGFGSVENYWRIEGWHSGNVTHWMPLPEPPEVQA